MTHGNEHYRRLLRRWNELEAQATLTPKERAEKAQIEVYLARVEMGWGR